MWLLLLKKRGSTLWPRADLVISKGSQQLCPHWPASVTLSVGDVFSPSRVPKTRSRVTSAHLIHVQDEDASQEGLCTPPQSSINVLKIIELRRGDKWEQIFYIPSGGRVFLRLVCKFPMCKKKVGMRNIGAAGSPQCSISWLMGSSNINTIPISLISTFSHWNGNQSLRNRSRNESVDQWFSSFLEWFWSKLSSSSSQLIELGLFLCTLQGKTPLSQVSSHSFLYFVSFVSVAREGDVPSSGKLIFFAREIRLLKMPSKQSQVRLI